MAVEGKMGEEASVARSGEFPILRRSISPNGRDGAKVCLFGTRFGWVFEQELSGGTV